MYWEQLSGGIPILVLPLLCFLTLSFPSMSCTDVGVSFNVFACRKIVSDDRLSITEEKKPQIEL